MNKTHYAAGFLFDPTLQYVTLIKKNRPTWQAGKYNAIGGHREPGETILNTMRREFHEEAGLQVPHWDHFAILKTIGAIIHFFRAEWPDLSQVTTMTDEIVQVFPIIALPKKRISNLPWLIQMAMPTSRQDWPYIIEEQTGPQRNFKWDTLISK